MRLAVVEALKYAKATPLPFLYRRWFESKENDGWEGRKTHVIDGLTKMADMMSKNNIAYKKAEKPPGFSEDPVAWVGNPRGRRSDAHPDRDVPQSFLHRKTAGQSRRARSSDELCGSRDQAQSRGADRYLHTCGDRPTEPCPPARLVDQVSAARLDPDRANMLQALDQTEHGTRLGGRHLPQPGQPVLVGLFPTLCQRIEPASLLGGETIGQPAIHLPTGLVAELGAEPLECGRRRNDDPALPACLHHQLGQIGEPIILNGFGQKGACQFGCGTFAERTKPELLLAFDGMTLAVPLRREILVQRVRKNPDLLGDECEQGRRRSLAGAQRSAGVAQVAEHESVAEAVVISAAAPDCSEIGLR